jgi:hypothetical protein
LTIDSPSVPLDFVAKMPVLERLDFEELALTEEAFEPLANCQSLCVVVLDDCFHADRVGWSLLGGIKVSKSITMSK